MIKTTAPFYKGANKAGTGEALTLIDLGACDYPVRQTLRTTTTYSQLQRVEE